MARGNQQRSNLERILSTSQEMDGPEGTRLAQQPEPGEIELIRTQGLWKKCTERIGKVCERLNEVFVQKETLIQLMCWSTVAQMPMLLLGPWGTGKSFLVRSFARCLGLITEGDRRAIDEADSDAGTLRQSGKPGAPTTATRYFEYLVTRFTTPEELLGPVDIDLLLKNAVYHRHTIGLLPRAEMAFLDEVFKANSAILNALLSLINERLFYNAGQVWRVPLTMLFGASNEAPEEEELGAFFDRFPVRALCDRVTGTPDSLRDLLARSHAQQFTRHTSTTVPRFTQLASLNDFRLLQHLTLHLFGGPQVDSPENRDFLELFLRAVGQLREEYDISDRSCGFYYRLARARALLANRTTLERGDCEVLGYGGKDVYAARHLPEVVQDLIRSA